DFIVCFESLEHIAEDRAFFEDAANAVRVGGLLLVSAPNEARIPLSEFSASYPFHCRHYRWEDVVAMAAQSAAALRLEAWYGQDSYRVSERPWRRQGLLADSEMSMKRSYHGQALVFLFRRIS